MPITVTWDSVAATSYPTTGDITVNVATDGAGAASSTATQVKDKVNLDATAQLLVSVTNASGNDGTGIVGALAFANLHDGDDGWNLTATQVAQGIEAYINRMQVLCPTIEGYTWHESQVLIPYNGVAGYSSQTYPTNQQPDFKDTIDTVLTYLAGVGLLPLIEAFHDDDAIENDDNTLPSSHQFADDWYARHFVIQQQFAGYGVKYGISFVTTWGGTPGAPSAPAGSASDALNQAGILSFLRNVIAKHHSSYVAVLHFDVIEGMFFQYHPQTLAPDTVAGSTMDTYERVMGAYGLVAGSGDAPSGTAFLSVPGTRVIAPVPAGVATSSVPLARSAAPVPVATATSPRPS